VSIIPAFIAYRLVAGPAPVSRARKYAAWASITAVAAYIKIIGDLVLGTFNGITVVQSVSMGVWAVIFMAVAYFIGHVCDKSSETGGARSAPSGLAQQPSPLPPAEDLLVARFASRSQITMNHAQRRIAIIGLLSLAAILAVIFVRIGEVSDYKNAILVLRLSEIDNPNAGFPYQPLTIGWGLIARTGLAGIFCGIVLPLVLVFAALFVKQGMK
jgi:hypothetical protein